MTELSVYGKRNSNPEDNPLLRVLGPRLRLPPTTDKDDVVENFQALTTAFRVGPTELGTRYRYIDIDLDF